MELISIREASRRIGVSDTAIHKAIKTGRVTVEDRTESGRPLVGWPLAQEQWKANTNEAKRTHIGERATVTVSVKPPPVAKTGRPAITGAKPKADAGPAKPAPPPAERASAPPEPPPPPADPPARDEPTPPRSGGGVPPTYAESRAIREAFMARLAKLEYEEKSGKLVPVDQVKADAFKTARIIRDGLLNIPDRVAHELAHETDPTAVHLRLTAEFRAVLEALADGIAQ